MMNLELRYNLFLRLILKSGNRQLSTKINFERGIQIKKKLTNWQKIYDFFLLIFFGKISIHTDFDPLPKNSPTQKHFFKYRKNFCRLAILNITKITTILCAKRVRNVFDGVAQTVSKIVCWVNAPFVSGSMMRRKFNSISDRILFTIRHHVFHTQRSLNVCHFQQKCILTKTLVLSLRFRTCYLRDIPEIFHPRDRYSRLRYPEKGTSVTGKSFTCPSAIFPFFISRKSA